MAKKITKKKAVKKPFGGKPCTDGMAARLEQHELFCIEYTKDGNATRAYIAAGYSENGASASACALLAQPKIAARVTQLQDERKARVLLEGDDILREIQKLATSDIRRLIDPTTGCVLPTDEWPDDIAVAVASFEVIEKYHPITGKLTGYIKKFKLWDKPKSQEMIGRSLALFTDVVKNDTTLTVAPPADADQVKAMRDKIKNDC